MEGKLKVKAPLTGTVTKTGGMVMERIALNTAGIIFLVVAELHLVRWVMKVPLIVGDTSIPPVASAVGAVGALLLALWMLVVARMSGTEKRRPVIQRAAGALDLE